MRFATNVGMEYRMYHKREISGSSCIKDLSREGMCCSISKKLEKGTLLDMKFLLPGDVKPIYLTGEVMWANESKEKKEFGYIVGVKFSKIDNFDRMRLLDHAYTEWLKLSK